MRKKLLITVACIAVMLLAGCATTADRQEVRVRTAGQVVLALDDRHYTIDIDMMYPMRGRSVNVTSDYSLEIRGDSVISYLPYFGRAYHLPYGGGKGLSFSAPLQRYEAVRAKKNMTRIIAETMNEEDSFQFQIDVFDNGNATIYVQSREREPISYSGQMVLEN